MKYKLAAGLSPYFLALMLAVYVLGPLRLIGPTCWNNYKLATHNIHTPGIVIALHPENHSSVEYKFEYMGVSYEGEEMMMHNLTIGSPVTVTFLANNPSLSIISDAWADMRQNAASLFLILAFMILCYFMTANQIFEKKSLKAF